MAKRFTDTEKWRDEWYGSLSNDYRIVWQYLLDSCSIAGVWKKDFRGLNFNCNTNLTEEEFLMTFGTRVIDRKTFFFIPKFLRFQYPKGLNSNKPAIVSVVKELVNNKLTTIVNQSLGNDFLIIKDKDKDKDKDMDKEQDKDKCEKNENYITVDNVRCYNALPYLEVFEAALNGRCREQQSRNWRDLLPEWFNQNLQIDFNDGKHIFNSFSKFIMFNGQPKNGHTKPSIPKLTLEDLNS